MDLHLLDPEDTVGIAMRDLAPGTTLDLGGSELTVVDTIPSGHKVALHPIGVGERVVKYGHVIGQATAPIRAGAHVHLHNLAFADHSRPSAQLAGSVEAPTVELPERRTFHGIPRADGTVATRNMIAVVTTVNCSATVARMIADEVEHSGVLDPYPTIDGIVAVTHQGGCGAVISSLGMRILQRTLAGYATHANVGGVVLVGLGCEMNLMAQLLERTQVARGVPVVAFDIQDLGGTRSAVKAGVAAVTTMAPVVARVSRQEVPVSGLTVGLNCGGSDGWSGVTANPALGYASDLIIAQGGRTTLAEAPEVYGAEDLLVRRATSPQVAQKLLDQLAWWEDYVAADGGTMNNNPSPGNNAGGITTILEKALGAVAKGGHSPLTAVHDYAERITTPGLSFMNTPGYDPVSVTGLVAGGANLICFTTGRGSAIGTRPAPTLKLATNTALFRRMTEDMDVNCGDIVDDGISIADKGLEIYHRLLDVASGQRTKSEELGYGTNEFVPWHIGAVM